MESFKRKNISEIKNIGFVSTRFAGTDGVSLETQKWATVLDEMGYRCFYFAGELDRPKSAAMLSPRAHFKHPVISQLNEFVFSHTERPEAITDQIDGLKKELKADLKEFIARFDIELIIAENVLAIPLNVPLGLALTEIVAETSMPVVAHNHDFFWERKRFSINCVWDYLNKAFPPRHPHIRQVVINSEARTQVALRRGVAAIIIPNIMDYEKPPALPDEYTADVRHALGIADGEYFILQPTRVVQRKGIEHAIELIRRLSGRGVKAKLVISHASGDEGDHYEHRVREYSDLLKVNTLFVSDIIGDTRGTTANGRKIYSLRDVYPHADFVTYPSTYEGFGNAFLEAIYFKKPLLIKNYSIYTHNIKPKGFKVVEIDDYITEEAVSAVETLLKDRDLVREMTDYNYDLARRFYSYSMLRTKLRFLLSDFFGEE